MENCKILLNLSSLLFCRGESHWTEHRTGRKVLVDRTPRPKLGVDHPEQDWNFFDKGFFVNIISPEQDAGEQGGRATDVDREHQVDLACVLHLERDGRIMRVMMR